MNVGTLTISLTARTAGLVSASARVRSFEKGVLASAQRINRSMLMVGQAFSALTIPIAAFGGAATKIFSEFEFSLAKVTGLVGVASDVTQKWGEQILEMGKYIGKTPTELANALYYVTSAGIRGAETMDVLAESAKSATAGLGDTATVADALTSAMNAYGKANLSAAEANDILIYSIREGKVEPEELASSIGKVFPIAAQLGVTFNDVGAAIASMTRTGTKASTSAIYLRRVLSSILDPSVQAKVAIRDMGDSFFNFRNMLEEKGGLLNVLMRVKEMVDTFGEESVSELFPNLRAIIPVLDLIGKNLNDNIKIFENAHDVAGIAGEAFRDAADTFHVKWNRAVSAVESAFIRFGKSIGTTLIPTLNKFSYWVTDLTDKWDALGEATQKQIVKFGLLVAAIGPLTVVIGGLVNVVLTLISSFVMLVKGIGATVISFFTKLKNISLATAAPLATIALEFSAIVAAVFILNTAIWALAQSWESITIKMAIGWNKIILAALKAVRWFQTTDFKEMFTGLWNSFKSFFIELTMSIVDWFERVWDVALKSIKQGLSKLTTFVKSGGLGPMGGASFWEMMFPETDASDIANKVIDWFSIYKLKPTGGNEGMSVLEETEAMIAEIETANEKWSKMLEGKEGFGEAFNRNLQIQFDSMKKGADWLKNSTKALIGGLFGDFTDMLLGFSNLFNMDSAYWRQIAKPETEEPLQMESWMMTAFQKQPKLETKEFDAFSGALTKLQTGLENINYDYTNYGEIIDVASERTRLIGEFMSRVQEIGGPFTPEQLDIIKQYSNELEPISQSFSLIQEQIGNASTLFSNFSNILTNLGVESESAFGKMLSGVEKLFSVLNSVVTIIETFNKIQTVANTLSNVNTAMTWLEIIALRAKNKALTKQLVLQLALTAVGGGGLPIIGNIFSGSSSLFGAMLGMKDGGIIPSGYEGDRFPAMLNSGEAVIPLDRLPQLLNINKDKNKKVIFHIDGKQLVGTLVAQNKAYNAF